MKKLLVMAVFLAAASPAGSLAQDEAAISIEEFLQKLSTVQGIMGRKDPFISAEPPFDTPAQKEEEGGVISSNPVMQRYPIKQYGVVATLLGDQYPRALVKLPQEEQGKVVIVKLKDKLGSRNGIITKILKEGIVVVESRKSPIGRIEKSEVVLSVGAAAPTTTEQPSAPPPSAAPAAPPAVGFPKGFPKGFPGAR